MRKEALVVKREVLFKNKSFQGFLPQNEHDFISLILDNYMYHPRGEQLEHNSELQQIIPYVWIVNPLEKKVFLYKRALNGNKKEGEYRETRYLNKYAGGVGGHIDRDTEEGLENPIFHAMMRELREEVVMEHYSQPKIVGYLNDDEDDLGKVHFGIAAIAETNGKVSTKKEEGLAEGAFYQIEEVDAILSDSKNEIETWTKISWPFVKEYLLSK